MLDVRNIWNRPQEVALRIDGTTKTFTPGGDYEDFRIKAKHFVNRLPKASFWCCWDLVSQGGLELKEVGEIMGWSKQRVSQIEREALRAVGEELDD